MVGWGDRWCLGRAVPLAIEGPMAEETRGIKWVAEAVDSTLIGTSGLSIPFIRDFAYGIVCMSQKPSHVWYSVNPVDAKSSQLLCRVFSHVESR